ncbi:MAG: hypothetical protein RL018_618 [Pseudomonadota bacterium]|jgi:hypothetical protein
MPEPTTKPEKTKPMCFVIMPIADVHGYESGHFGRVYEHLLKPAIEAAGFRAERADDAVKTDYIVVTIIRKIVEADMVLCDFSARNPNVMYELGLRHAFNKPVTLIKDRRTEKIFDIQGLRYTEYDDSLRVDSVRKDVGKIAESVRETLKTEGDSINSLVQIAGIKTAQIPESQTISADTQLVLSAIKGLEHRISKLENLDHARGRYFLIVDNGKRVIFDDQSEGYLGSTISQDDWLEIGKLTGIDLNNQSITIKTNSGALRRFHAFDPASKALNSDIPF